MLDEKAESDEDANVAAAVGELGVLVRPSRMEVTCVKIP